MRKYYAYNLVGNNGQLVGGGIARVWFWGSPYEAHRNVRNSLPDGTWITDFRRIK